MSGECDICGDYGHVEYSCPHRWNRHVEFIKETEEWAQDAARQVLKYLEEAKHPGFYDVSRIITGELEQHKDNIEFWRGEGLDDLLKDKKEAVVLYYGTKRLYCDDYNQWQVKNKSKVLYGGDNLNDAIQALVGKQVTDPAAKG